ncbi:hypothetical protein Trydic_g1301 [Trypoxylus dichotomus]
MLVKFNPDFLQLKILRCDVPLHSSSQRPEDALNHLRTRAHPCEIVVTYFQNALGSGSRKEWSGIMKRLSRVQARTEGRSNVGLPPHQTGGQH